MIRFLPRVLLTATLTAVGALAAERPLPRLSARAAARVLEQGSWGPTAATIQDLQTVGLQNWLAAQFTAPISTYADQPLLNAKGFSNGDLTPITLAFFQNALNGPDQLRQRVGFALSEIWVISQLGVDDAQGFPPLLRVFQNRAFDNYESLMTDVTLNPGMGIFLNMVNNNKADPAKNTAANENYARELMQLFTLGLTQLNQDGTPILDSSGNTQATFTQDTVTNLAKALTGWTYPAMPGSTSVGHHNPRYFIGSMVPLEFAHDTSAKTIFGTTLPAGQTAEQDLQQALHIIFMQANLPPFISKQLIQHLVTSNPGPAYIERVANVFADNGSGVRGDMKAVITAILTDPEARYPDRPWDRDLATFGHLKEPVVFLTNLLRGLNGTLAADSKVYYLPAFLDQQLFYAPSVFSYFSPQYALGPNFLAPEFQIYSTQTAANRINVVNAAVYGGKTDAGTKFDISSFTGLAGNSQSLLAQIDTVFFHQAMSITLKEAIVQAMQAQSTASSKAQAALYLALTSSEYQLID